MSVPTAITIQQQAPAQPQMPTRNKFSSCCFTTSITAAAVITSIAMCVYQNMQAASCEKMLDDSVLSCYDKTCHASYVERCQNEYSQSSRLFNYYSIPTGVAVFSIFKLVIAKRMASNQQVGSSWLHTFFKRIIYKEQSFWSIGGFCTAASIALGIGSCSFLFPDFFPNPYCRAEQGPFCSGSSTSCLSMPSSLLLPKKVCDLSDSINHIDYKTYVSFGECALLTTLLVVATYRAHIKVKPVNHHNVMPASTVVSRTSIAVRTTVPIVSPYHVP